MIVSNGHDICVIATGEISDSIHVFTIAMRLRRWGYSVIHDVEPGRSLKAQMRMADKAGCKYAVVLHDDSGEAVSIKHLRQGCQVDNLLIPEEIPSDGLEDVEHLTEYMRPTIFSLADFQKGDWLYHAGEKRWDLFLSQEVDDRDLTYRMADLGKLTVANLRNGGVEMLVSVYTIFPLCIPFSSGVQPNVFIKT